MADASTDARLRQVFNFDADDLAANHLGRLTARQARAASAVLAARRQRMAIIWGVVGLAILLPIILSSVFDGAGLRSRQWTMFIPFVLTIVLVAGGVLYETLAEHRRTRDLRSRQISQVEGAAILTTARQVRYTVYVVQIDQIRFEFTSPEQQGAFEATRRYRVFYVASPPRHTILSVESLADLA